MKTTASPYNLEIAPKKGRRPLAQSSGVLSRKLDPSILRQIREIDSSLVIEWRPNGQWWPGSQIPPGARLGCWRICVRGKSGRLRGMRMWPPDAADGRLVRHLTHTWKRMLQILESDRPEHVKQRQLDQMDRENKEMEKAEFVQWWENIDHKEMYRAVKAEHEAPKWRGNWNVPDNLAAP